MSIILVNTKIQPSKRHKGSDFFKFAKLSFPSGHDIVAVNVNKT